MYRHAEVHWVPELGCVLCWYVMDSTFCMQAGTPVMVLPSGETGTVRSVEVDGSPAELATAGDSADLTLSGGLPAATERTCCATSLSLLSLSAVSLAGLNTEQLLCVQVLTLQC